MALAELIKKTFENKPCFKLSEAYEAIPDKPATTIRGRIYDNLDIKFKKLAKGVYAVLKEEDTCLILEGDGRNLSFLDDDYIDAIITDHPWEDKSANKGGSRNFATYNCFKYTQEDFNEKYRVLKPGAFLVEVIPCEKESNFEYLYELKKMAIKAGFKYYANIPYKKLGGPPANCGRTSKKYEYIMIFSKGRARALKPDAKKNKNLGGAHYMSGTTKMLPPDFDFDDVGLPTEFCIEQVPRKDIIEQSEKPIKLWEAILEYITNEHEIVLDQFAGSGSVGEACLNKNRNCILIEIVHEKIESMCNRFKDKQVIQYT